ncbi:type II toxin-antitoxin system HicA family toxin [Candidatus Poribacteria bacterium]|nr:type II toxin-antitoxin system HicA family toxin [Candidatus Poribacteria bacterium]
MMPPLPIVGGMEAVRAFERLGWRVARQRVSHIILTRPGSMATLSIPDHRELDRGTLRSLLRAARVTVEQFVEALA